jgi:hypothetical protein
MLTAIQVNFQTRYTKKLQKNFQLNTYILTLNFNILISRIVNFTLESNVSLHEQNVVKQFTSYNYE